ncbi:hypothetical protein [Mesorhizobium denitrificans]|nr:hypothetical protein [Mesorhizobium denitrificans]
MAIALRRAKLAVISYGLIAVFLLCGIGFLIGAGYIYAADRYGSLHAALGFAGGFVLLALLVWVIFKLSAPRREKRRAALRKSEISAVAAASGIAIASNLLRSRAGIGMLATPLIGYLAYQIIKENSSKSPPRDEE